MPRPSLVIWSIAVLAGVAPSAASAAVLYDQLDNVGMQATASSDPPGAGNATETADDFTVPSGQIWSVDGVDVIGAGVGLTSSIDVSVYADVASLPGALVASRAALAPGGADPDWSVTLGPPVDLAPGAYWIAVKANTTAPSWGWRNRTVQSGAGAAFRSEAVVGTCPGDFTFRRKTTCLGSVDPDQVFRLRGTAGPLPAAPAGPTPSCGGRASTIVGTAASETLSGTRPRT